MKIQIILITTFLGIPHVIAGEPTVESLERRVAVLEEKVAALGAQISATKNDEEESITLEPVARGEIIIDVLEDGSLLVEGKELDDDAFTKFLKAMATQIPNSPVRIRGSGATKFENIIHAINLCQKAGIWNISFATAAMPSKQTDPDQPASSSESNPEGNEKP